jgi:hypothetical protein
VELQAHWFAIAIEAAFARVVDEWVAIVDQEPTAVQHDAGIDTDLRVERHDLALLAERTEAGEAAAVGVLTAAVNMKAARAQGRALTRALTCAQPAARSQTAAPSLIRAPVVVVTDAACFSSCLGTLEFFRKLGAIQVGQSTNADTHNSEVRDITLPSGLSMFTTLQAIMPDEPYQIGPFTPADIYAGDIADRDAVARWITDTVLPAHHVAPRVQPPAR